MEDDTIFVHQRLKAGRAMMLCWSAKMDIKMRSTTIAIASAAVAPLSIVLGTTKFPTKPMA